MEKPGGWFSQAGNEKQFLSKDADLFLKNFYFGCFFVIFTVANKLPGVSISKLANVEDFLNVDIFFNCKNKCEYKPFFI